MPPMRFWEKVYKIAGIWKSVSGLGPNMPRKPRARHTWVGKSRAWKCRLDGCIIHDIEILDACIMWNM